MTNNNRSAVEFHALPAGEQIKYLEDFANKKPSFEEKAMERISRTFARHMEKQGKSLQEIDDLFPQFVEYLNTRESGEKINNVITGYLDAKDDIKATFDGGKLNEKIKDNRLRHETLIVAAINDAVKDFNDLNGPQSEKLNGRLNPEINPSLPSVQAALSEMKELVKTQGFGDLVKNIKKASGPEEAQQMMRQFLADSGIINLAPDAPSVGANGGVVERIQLVILDRFLKNPEVQNIQDNQVKAAVLNDFLAELADPNGDHAKNFGRMNDWLGVSDKALNAANGNQSDPRYIAANNAASKGVGALVDKALGQYDLKTKIPAIEALINQQNSPQPIQPYGFESEVKDKIIDAFTQKYSSLNLSDADMQTRLDEFTQHIIDNKFSDKLGRQVTNVENAYQRAGGDNNNKGFKRSHAVAAKKVSGLVDEALDSFEAQAQLLGAPTPTPNPAIPAAPSAGANATAATKTIDEQIADMQAQIDAFTKQDNLEALKKQYDSMQAKRDGKPDPHAPRLSIGQMIINKTIGKGAAGAIKNAALAFVADQVFSFVTGSDLGLTNSTVQTEFRKMIYPAHADDIIKNVNNIGLNNQFANMLSGAGQSGGRQ